MYIKNIENFYHLELNDISFDDNENVSSLNSTWFILRKKILEERMNDYNLKEGDIIRIGRITVKIKKIKFQKNERNKNNDKNNEDNISIDTNLKEFPIEKKIKNVYEKYENQKNKICRICYLEDDAKENPLIQPCICSGSMKYIHLDCLNIG